MRHKWTDGSEVKTDENGIIELPMERPGYYKVDEKWVLFSRGMTVCVCDHEFDRHDEKGCIECWLLGKRSSEHEFKEMYLTSHPDVESAASANHAG